jgi:hypothetical protein
MESDYGCLKKRKITVRPIPTDDELRIRNSELERENTELKVTVFSAKREIDLVSIISTSPERSPISLLKASRRSVPVPLIGTHLGFRA